jgi:hypothetical protein
MKPCLTATDWFLLLLVVLLGAWDVLAYGTGWMPTISATIRGWASHNRLIPMFYVLLGAVLFFHLFLSD